VVKKQIMNDFFTLLEKLLKIILLILISSMSIDVLLQIVARKILSISIPWTEELARYLMVWIGFIGLGVAYRVKGLHIINILTEKLSEKRASLFSFISNILILIFLISVIPYGIKTCILNIEAVTPALRIPSGYVFAAIPVGCSFTLLFVLESMWEFLKSI
jgi:TRAP-type C4-dicarboxylate transport system permease small subunit